MSPLNDNRAREVLDFCLAHESPQIRSKVYEIINLSGLDKSDPLFLVLALTGQIRVFLEAAPVELRQLLDEWKKQNAESLSQIDSAISLVINSHQETADIIKQNLEAVTSKCVSDIKEVGMATTGAIAAANEETLAQARQAREEARELIERVSSLHASIEAKRQANKETMTSIIEQFQQTTVELNTANLELKSVILLTKKFQQQTSWAKRAEWFTPLLALLVMGFSGGIAGGWLTSRFYNSPAEVWGRNLLEWNRQQLVECMQNNNSQCRLWIVPPNSSP